MVLDMGNVWMVCYLIIEIFNLVGYKVGGVVVNCMCMIMVWLICVSCSERIVWCVCVIIGLCMFCLFDNF